MDLELRHLRVVCAIEDAGSLTRAAAALRTTQPALSAQLRRIETMLGGALFDRRHAGVVTTAFGELVLTRARAILPGVDGLLADTARAARRRDAPGRVRIGSVGAPLLGHLILAVREVLPGAELTARCRNSPVPLLEDIAAERLEAAVLGDNPGQELPSGGGVELWPLVTEPVFALLSSSHPLAAREEVSLGRLVEEDWAVPRPDSDRTREYWSTVFAMTGGQPRAPYEAEGRQLVELVRSGLAVSLCQATYIEVPGVAVRPLAGNPLWYRHVLAWHREGPLAAYGDEIVRKVGAGYLATCAASPSYARWRERHPHSGQLTDR
ncbi:DNA-binding transcriptional LysR family regulator [Streptomyces olivoverticillatus]|uniref:DNA-binding transcriptional LysR family regulator n=1 Tax=Streptomyces olivoverticillatus TaxID=66427 RepID=A0A7W7PMN7_9ACTN|nr:LysR family transcriptional regulator [Streptomyces olivoverticillatus]MBB4895564.1 DNA-binding transcriptional LysR family regulator [Streptomyces olivoverticillatus]